VFEAFNRLNFLTFVIGFHAWESTSAIIIALLHPVSNKTLFKTPLAINKRSGYRRYDTQIPTLSAARENKADEITQILFS